MAAEGTLGLFLLLGGSLLAGYLGHLLFRRHGISDVILLLFAGLLAGPVLGLAHPGLLAPALPFLAPLGLVIVLFEGGLELAWADIRAHAGRAVTMALVAWTLTTMAAALVGHLLLGLGGTQALLLGLTLAATGILVVIPLLAQMRAPPAARVVLTVETALGDLLSAVAVTAICGILVLGSTPQEGALLLGATFLVGAAVGLLAGIAWARVLHATTSDAHGWPLTVGALCVTYAAAEVLGGSGFLGALAFGLFLGNARALVEHGGLRALAAPAPSLRLHQTEIIFVLRSLYFVYIGIAIPRGALGAGALVTLVALTGAMVIARLLAVHATIPARTAPERAQRMLLAGMMPRGLAAALIAGIPAAMGVPGTEGFLLYAFLAIVGMDVATSVGLWVYRRQGVASGVAGMGVGVAE